MRRQKEPIVLSKLAAERAGEGQDPLETQQVHAEGSPPNASKPRWVRRFVASGKGVLTDAPKIRSK